jgi:hypothetical protein
VVARAQTLVRRGDADSARQALALLDQQASSGLEALAPEAAVARLEALLRLGREPEARQLLDGLDLTAQPRRRELHVLRGELHAARGGCAVALADFTAALQDRRDLLEERALFGRASCALAGDRLEQARVDLERYLERFPQGRFAGRVREALRNER